MELTVTEVKATGCYTVENKAISESVTFATAADATGFMGVALVFGWSDAMKSADELDTILVHTVMG